MKSKFISYKTLNYCLLLLMLCSLEVQAMVNDSLVANCKDNKTVPQMHDIAFTAKIDSSEQHYVEILPDAFDTNKVYDLIIGLHGHGSDRWQFATDKRSECTAFRQIAAKYNMIAISPDYRAKTSWMGLKAEEDIVQIIYDLKKKYKVNRVYIVGASMGGTSALTFAVLHCDLINGVTSMNGHGNHLEYVNFQDAIAESFGGTKEQIPLEYKKRSAEYWPERLTVPVVFTVGGNDKKVPPGSAIRLAEILKKLNHKVMIIIRPKVGHSTNFEDAMVALEFMINPVK